MARWVAVTRHVRYTFLQGLFDDCSTVTLTAKLFSPLIKGSQSTRRSVCPSLVVASALAAGWYLCSADLPCLCDTSEDSRARYAQQSITRTFQLWLEENGGDLSAVDIKPSENTSARLGLFTTTGISNRLQRPWWQSTWNWITRNRPPNVVATFPLELSITTQTVIDQPVVGPLYQEFLELGLVDERLLVVLFLLVERVKGSESKWAPWFDVLPTTFDTPLFYSDQDLVELKGTALHQATSLKRKQLVEVWRRLEPAVRQLMAASKLNCLPTQEQFLWAYALFWSRSISLPLWPTATPSAESSAPSAGSSAHPAESSAPSAASSSQLDGGLLNGPLEGIVPGLDMCNHQSNAACWWTLYGMGNKPIAAAPTNKLCLVCDPKLRLHPHQEVTISYGDKSNEEMMFLYGFTDDMNPHDHLMISCPLPPRDSWDDVMAARMMLLQRKGLVPQFFLPASVLQQRHGAEGESMRGPADVPLIVPEGVLQLLKVLVMTPEQLAQELEGTGEAKQTNDGTKTASAEAAALQMAALTTLVRLLEMKVIDLEGEDGTGVLEDDVKLLEKDSLPPTVRSCVVYRAAQKRLAREYLIRAHSALSKEMKHLQKLLNN